MNSITLNEATLKSLDSLLQEIPTRYGLAIITLLDHAAQEAASAQAQSEETPDIFDTAEEEKHKIQKD